MKAVVGTKRSPASEEGLGITPRGGRGGTVITIRFLSPKGTVRYGTVLYGKTISTCKDHFYSNSITFLLYGTVPYGTVKRTIPVRYRLVRYVGRGFRVFWGGLLL